MTDVLMDLSRDLGLRESALCVVVCALLFALSRSLFYFTAGLLLGAAIVLHLHPFVVRLNGPVNRVSRGDNAIQEGEKSPVNLQRMSLVLRESVLAAANLLVKDYICWWYEPAFPGEGDFPAICTEKLLQLAANVHTSMARKDWAFIFDVASTNLVATVGSALHDVRLVQQENYSLQELERYTSVFPDSLLSQLLDSTHQAWLLEHTAGKLLEKYMVVDDIKCVPANLFLRKIVSRHVLGPAISALVGADAINLLIIQHFAPEATQVAHTGLQEALQAAAERVEDALDSDTPVITEDSQEDAHALQDGPPQALPSVPASPKRGRRLSFKERLSGVESSDITRLSLDEPDLQHKRKSSLLARTSSFLSKSRSRSTSPVKSPLLRPSLGSRAQTATDLYLAELAVCDASEHEGPIDMQKTVMAGSMPQLTIMISPTKLKSDDTVAKGICIVKSMHDLELLHQHFLSNLAKDELAAFPRWKSLTYSQLETESLSFLTSIVQSSTLARSEAFMLFCRQDLDFETRMKALGQSIEQMSPRLERRSLDTPTRPKSPTKPLSPFRRNPAFRFPSSTGERPQSALSHSRATSRSVSPFKNQSQETLPNSTRSWRDNASPLDVQGLVDQCMALLTGFFALSNKTWTIRRQLLNLLRGVLLSPGSSSLQMIVKQVEGLFDYWIDGDAVAVQIQSLCKRLSSEAPAAETPSVDESKARAEAAKQLLLRRGVPQAIKSLMGATPTNEATLILFEVLQKRELMQGLLTMIVCDVLSVIMNA